MTTRKKLEAYAQADIRTCDPRALVDLKDVAVDTALPVSQRVRQFLDQVHNPYLFKVDGIVVKVNYRGNQDLSSALSGLLASQGFPLLGNADS